MTLPGPPESEQELVERAERLAGWPLSRVARSLGVPVPDDQRRAKGWIGVLLEQGLGATAGNKAEPDFPHLGVELKTLPIDARGQPRESTYVCTAPMDGRMAARWEDCWVRHKLACVLWVPVVGGPDVPLAQRRLGAPLLWRPAPDEAATLQSDWEALAELIAEGEIWQLHARHGEALQIRPKAARASERVWVLDAEGQWVRENPKGFYLRARFTAAMLQRRFAMPN